MRGSEERGFKKPHSSGQRSFREKTGGLHNLSFSLNLQTWPGAGWDQAPQPPTPTLFQPEEEEEEGEEGEEVKVSQSSLQSWLWKDPRHTREAIVRQGQELGWRTGRGRE